MKLVRAMIRPEREFDVLQKLEDGGYYAMSKTPILGRGIERGIQVGNVTYDEIAKIMLMLIVEDKDEENVSRLIEEGARTGNPGDGRIFVQDVAEVYSIRKGCAEAEAQ